MFVCVSGEESTENHCEINMIPRQLLKILQIFFISTTDVQVYQSRVLSVCPFSRLSIQSFDHSVVWSFSRLILMFPTYVHFPESLQNLLCSALQQMSDLAVHHEVMSHHVKGLIVLWVVPLQVIYNGHLQTLFLPLRYHFD